MSAKNEHLIVSLLDTVNIGETFIDWPLHITLVPWFPVMVGAEKELDITLNNVASRHNSIIARVGRTAMFGGKRDIKVNLIEPNDALTNLHIDIFDSLENNQFPIHQKTFCKDKYTAHISEQKDNVVREGEEYILNKFALIKQVRQKITGTMVKELVKEYSLNG